MLINLDQAKAFDRVNHWFLATVLETTRFKPGFHKWNNTFHNTQAVVQANGKLSEAFGIKQSVQQCCPLFPLLYVLTLEPLLHRLRNGAANKVLHGIPFASCLRAKVSMYTNDITVFVSCQLDIKAVKKVVERYEEVTGVKINFDKSKGLWLGAWRGGVPLLGPFCWSDRPIYILRFRPGLQLKWNWSEVLAKVEVKVGIWLQRCLSLKGWV